MKCAGNLRIPRFFCRRCRRYWSAKFDQLDYRQKRSDLHLLIYLLLTSGVSQRRTARLLRTTQTTIARKLVRLSHFAEIHHALDLAQTPPVACVEFDEMETFEHSKCKPLSIAVAVESTSRKIIAARVARMPAKGRLAAVARRRYGYRKDCRKPAVAKVLGAVAGVRGEKLSIKSDKCPRYPRPIREILPHAEHIVFLSRRACVVGLGEMKEGGFDPLFSINHTCAMHRDNIKRLSRRTWCTTKRADRLQALINLYVCAHNAALDVARGAAFLLPAAPGRRLPPAQSTAVKTLPPASRNGGAAM